MPAKRKAKPEDARRQLIGVSVLLREPQIRELITRSSRPVVLEAIHRVLDEFRERLAQGQAPPVTATIVSRVAAVVEKQEAVRLRPVVNATGILLHTGLGRAVLPQRAVDALAGLNRCCNLQIDLATGLRGQRDSACAALLCRLTGAEAAMLVNNNAAATFLLLSALCREKEVLISRGQLIEIGGSFRLPDCIHQSGARMVEVGTTNKTHLRDYEQALTLDTAMILRVNPSNYRVVGFMEEVSVAELVSLKKRPLPHALVVVDDLGCGALVDLSAYGLPKEPMVQESLAAGADLVCFSGDKLVGGPQAGIILGRKMLIDQLKKHPLSRLLRVGKLTALALEQTLRLFLEPETLLAHHPTLQQLTVPRDRLQKQALALIDALQGTHLHLRVIEDESAVGGGSLPAVPIPTYVLAVSSPALSSDELSRRLRHHEPPIIVRVANQEVQLDMRTLLVGDAESIVAALKQIASPAAPTP